MNKRALVMGLGLFGGGVASAKYLCELGYKVTVTDLRDRATLLRSVQALEGLDIEFRLGEHLESDFQNVELVAKSPAVRADNKFVQIARDAGAEITSEIVLFAKACRAPIIGVTGSNGKTTTSHMLHGILDAAWQKKGRKAWLGGNLGHSLLDDLATINEGDIVILELSSFQLMDLAEAKYTPDHALITNITPNHLNWHKDMAEYIRAKASVFLGSKPESQLVLNHEDEICQRLAKSSPGRVSWFGEGVSAGVAISDAGITAMPSKELLIASNGLATPGRHNLANAAAASALALALEVDPETIRKALHDFRGVAHRLEFVREVKGVRYFNDSIATTPESTIAAIRSFSCPISLLLGGSDKGSQFETLAQVIAHSLNIRKIYLNGPVSGKISVAIHEACRQEPNPNRALVVEEVPTFDEAIARASRSPIPGSAFLLSPSCASFYEFREGESFVNFEHRGDHFKALVEALS